MVKRETMLTKSSDISLNALQLVFRSSRSLLGGLKNITFAMPEIIELQSATLEPRWGVPMNTFEIQYLWKKTIFFHKLTMPWVDLKIAEYSELIEAINSAFLTTMPPRL